MKYAIRITALAVIIPALIVTYSDLLESDRQRLEVASTKTKEAANQPETESTPTFVYQDILENAVVQVEPVAEYISTSKNPANKYNKLLRVASFKSIDRAKSLQSKLIDMQFPNVQLAKSNKSDWYFVSVGPFENRSMLNKAQDQLAQMNYVTLVLNFK